MYLKLSLNGTLNAGPGESVNGNGFRVVRDISGLLVVASNKLKVKN